MGRNNDLHGIPKGQKIYARYQNTSSQSLAGGGATTSVNFQTKTPAIPENDGLSCVTSLSPFRFVSPKVAKYCVVSNLEGTTNASAGQSLALCIYKNGVLHTRGPQDWCWVGGASGFKGSVADILWCGKDDYIEIRLQNGSTNSFSTSANTACYVAIAEIGNELN